MKSIFNNKVILIIIVLVVLYYLIVLRKDDLIITKLSFTHTQTKFSSVPFKKRKILIITTEDRDKEYIRLHDLAFGEYATKHDYEYLRLQNCSKEEASTYWCKMYKVKKALELGIYDYVVWVDSDTIITNIHKSFDELISEFGEPDIIIGFDDLFINYFIPKFMEFKQYNAGIFFIKNTEVGKNFINDCISRIEGNSSCIVDGKEQGIWAGACYEQGIMNLLIKTKYKDYSYIDYSNKLLMNICEFNNSKNSKSIILHLAGFRDKKRAEVFKYYLK